MKTRGNITNSFFMVKYIILCWLYILEIHFHAFCSDKVSVAILQALDKLKAVMQQMRNSNKQTNNVGYLDKFEQSQSES